MKDNRRNIDEFFQEEFGGYTEMPPASVWESLEKRLDTKKSNKPNRIWWLYLIVAFALISGTIAAYLTMSNHQMTWQSLKSNNNTNRELNANDQSNNLAFSKNSEHINNSEKLNTEQFPNLSKPSFFNEVEDNASASSSTNSSSLIVTELEDHNERSNSGKSTNKPLSNEVVERKNAPIRNAKDTKLGQDLNQNSNKDYQKGVSVGDAKVTSAQTSSSTENQSSANAIESNSRTNKKSLANQNETIRKPEFFSGNKEIGKKKSEVLSSSDLKKSVTSTSTEKAVAKKPSLSQNQNEKSRGLSAFPEEDEADLLTLEPVNEKDSDFEPEEPAKEKPASKLLLQSEAIGKLRALNPLAAAPIAGKEIDETTDEEGNEIKAGGSGGGGGASASPKEKAKKSMNMAIGVKLGYEQGMQKLTAGKYVGTLFAEVKLSPKLSFVMQPSIKFGTVNREITGASLDTFINADAVQSSKVSLLDSAGKPNGFYDYYISQRYDSVTQTANFQKKFLEIEIPFLFRYKVDKNFSVLAGINFIFGKTPGFTTTDRILSSNVQYDSVKNVFDTVRPSIPSKFFAQGSSGKSNAIEELASPISPVRFGYTLGLSYVFRERLMVDLIVQQNLSGTSSISNAEVRKVFNQPYVRLSLGYTIFGNKKR